MDYRNMIDALLDKADERILRLVYIVLANLS